MSQPSLRRREKKQQHMNQRLCARIPKLTPEQVMGATSRPRGVSSPPANPGDRVRSDIQDTTRFTPAPRSPPPHPRAWHLSHSVALYHAAGRDFKRKLGVRGLVAAAGVERRRGRRRRRSGSFFSWPFFKILFNFFFWFVCLLVS